MKTIFGFDLQEAPQGQDVRETSQLKPRTSEAPFDVSKNVLEASRTAHGNLGELGDRSFSENGKK
jgi:hypothetical protein